MEHSDILMEIPWQCGEKDCKAQWHRATIWWHSKGKKQYYTEDYYSDGDAEPIAAKDVPTTAEYTRRWNEYHRYVAETGLDPISEFFFPSKKISTTTTIY